MRRDVLNTSQVEYINHFVILCNVRGSVSTDGASPSLA